MATDAEDDDVRMVGELAEVVDLELQVGTAAVLAAVAGALELLGAPALVARP